MTFCIISCLLRCFYLSVFEGIMQQIRPSQFCVGSLVVGEMNEGGFKRVLFNYNKYLIIRIRNKPHSHSIFLIF